MSDIFISYAREDRETAQRLAEDLEAQGWSVWWDTRLQAGEIWDDVIGRELAAARCVIVLWSKASVQRNWVRVEAEEGLRRRILVPVRIENVEPPLAFRLIHAGDLINWNGHRAHPGFKQLMASLANLLMSSPPPPTSMTSPPAEATDFARELVRHWWRSLRRRRRASHAPDFNRELAPESLPTALAAAVALRHRNELLMRRRGGTPRPQESAFDTAPARQARLTGSLRRNLLLKMIIYSVIAALTAR